MQRLSALLGAALALGGASVAHAQQLPPEWTHGATCYEIMVRSFQDSDGDGIGDFKGLISRLDYVNDGNPHSTRSLGARCIWLTPFTASPSYHGYDATDYYTVAKAYGSNADFKRFVAEAHKRGIKVIFDLVLNHVSSEHPWFQSALRDTASPYRDWFIWSKTPTPVKNWQGTVWAKSPVRDEYYYGIFWSGMPDLNYRNPAVVAEAEKIGKYWLTEMGVDGFRFDAIPYLVETDGVVAHTPATHQLLHDYQAYLRTVKPDVYTVGEVTYPNDTLLTYYPEQLESYFAFEVADSLIAAVKNGKASGMLAPVLRLQADVPSNRFAPLLSNHDQPRVRTKLGGDMQKTRLATFLLMTMPGVPFIYYGDDIGMIGDKPDPRIRTPMQWTSAKGAGFTTGTPWEALAPDSATVTVAAEDRDPHSVLTMVRRMVHLRASNHALSDGELIPLTASNDAVSAFVRRDGDRAVLVIANLSTTPLRDVTLSSTTAAIAPGSWTLRDLLGASHATSLHVDASGKLSGYVPLAELAPLEGYLFELTPARPER